MTHRLKYARIERERRFLVVTPPEDLERQHRWHRIEDRYLTDTRLRLRRTLAPDGAVVQRKLSQKIDVDSAHRVITTIDLDATEYAQLKQLPGAALCKRRFHRPWRGIELAIDVFEGALDGLVVAEVEASSDAALAGVPLPPFACLDVTDHPEFTGGRLATADPAIALALARRLAERTPAPAVDVPNETILVRAMAPADATTFASAFAAIGWHKPEALFLRYLDEHAAGTRVALVAERGGALAGYVTVVWSSDHRPFREAGVPEVQDLNVLPAQRRRGVASALLDEAEARIASSSREAGLGVGLHPGYNAAQRLYVQRGYVPDGRGVSQRGAVVAEGATARFDDDLLLHLVKTL